jgi:hypothetical protein
MKSARLVPVLSLPVVGPRPWLMLLLCMFLVDILAMLFFLMLLCSLIILSLWLWHSEFVWDTQMVLIQNWLSEQQL